MASQGWVMAGLSKQILPGKNVEFYYFWKCANFNRKIRENVRTIKNGDFQKNSKKL